MSQIKDLYYGNINHWEKPFIRDLEYGKEIKTVSETEEKLLALFNKTKKELFERFSAPHDNMNPIAIIDGFVDDSCLGMRIAIEVMEK